MNIHRSTGEVLLTQEMVKENDGFPFCLIGRAHSHMAFYEYALSLGIKINMGVRVTEYFENENEAGVVVNGVQHAADVVIGADGVNSKCRHFVTKRFDNPVSSGYAVYRAWIPYASIRENPLLEDLLTGKEDTMHAWIGPDVHTIVTGCKALESLTFVLTHKDEYAASETWAAKGKVEDVLQTLDGWDPKVRAIASTINPDKLIDWKLLWRDPIKQWVSGGHRIVLCGDSAHPFLPSSGNGASQAIEDATTIASALRLAGKENVGLALQAFEALR